MRTIRCLAGVIAVCSVLHAHVWAGQLSLGTSNVSGNPLMVPPGSSGSLLINVFSDAEPVLPRDYMTGWQTTLTLIPDTDAVGTLVFDSVSQPDNYVFDTSNAFGISSTISSTANRDDTVFAFDFQFPVTGGVAAPTAPRANLLETELSASLDASGTFGLFALSGPGDTLWTDAAQPVSVSRSFLNVPPDEGPQRIGDVVVVPETKTLQAGDADQNLQFDQFDIIKVSQARKYITGEPATWGEGDWNGAPGGSPGNPPPGDGVFDQFDLISALRAGNYLAGPYAAVGPGGLQLGDTKYAILARGGELETIELLSAESLESVTNLANVDNTYVAVPEPQSVCLLVAGALTMLAYASRRSARYTV